MVGKVIIKVVEELTDNYKSLQLHTFQGTNSSHKPAQNSKVKYLLFYVNLTNQYASYNSRVCSSK